MCYAIPGKVVGFDGKKAVVDYFGERKKALNEFIELKIGDYIYAQGGFVITKVSKKGGSGDLIGMEGCILRASGN